MLRLRKQVDQIDRKLLRLLQQRTELSAEIGQTKRRHGAEIYVPDRERELLARMTQAAGDKLPTTAVSAIFREILSSSRAAQGQAPIGVVDRYGGKQPPKDLLRWRRDDVASMIRAARGHFGACDRYVVLPDWRELARRLRSGKLAIGLLTFSDMVVALRDPYAGGLDVVGDFLPSDGRPGLDHLIFIVQPAKPAPTGNRALILIECKPTANAVKSLVSAMSCVPQLVQLAPLPGRSKTCLAALTFPRPVTRETLALPGAMVLGVYPASEAYGG
jgi:chorismate mutase